MSHHKQCKAGSTAFSQEMSEKSSKKKTISQSKVCKTNRQKENLSKTIEMNAHNHETTRINHQGLCKVVDEKNQTITDYESQMSELMDQNKELKKQKEQMRAQQIMRLKQYEIKNQESIQELNYLKQGLSEMKQRLEQLSIEKKTIGVQYHNSLKEIEQLTSNINILIIQKQQADNYQAINKELTIQISKKQQNLENTNSQFNKIQNHCHNLQKQLESKNSRQKELENTLNQVSSKYMEGQEQIIDLKAKEQSLKTKINTILQDLESERKWGRQQIQSYKIKLKSTEEELIFIRDQIYIQNLNYTSSNVTAESLMEELALNKQLIAKMSQQNKYLSEKVASLASFLTEERITNQNLIITNQNLTLNNQNLAYTNESLIDSHKKDIQNQQHQNYKIYAELTKLNKQNVAFKTDNEKYQKSQLKINELILENRRITDIIVKDKKQLNEIRDLYNSCTITLQMATKELQNIRSKYAESQLRFNEKNNQADRLSKELFSKENVIRRMTSEQKSRKEQITQLTLTINNQKQIHEQFHQRYQKIQHKFQALEGHLLQKETQYETKIKECQNIITGKSNRIKELENRIKDINNDLNLVKTEVASYRQHMDGVSQQRQENQQIIQSLQKKYESEMLSHQQRYQTLFQENTKKANRIKELEKQVERSHIQRQQLKNNFQTIKVECCQLQNQFTSVQEGFKRHQQQKRYLKQSLHQSQLKILNLVNNSTKDLQIHHQQKQSQRKTIQFLQNNIMTVERNLKRIQQEKQFLERNKINIQKIIEQKCENYERNIHNQQRSKEEFIKNIKGLEDKLTKLYVEKESIRKELEALRINNKQQQQIQREKNKQLQNSKITVEILRGQNQSLLKIMNDELNKRRMIIEDLVRQKKQLYEQIRK